MAYQAQDEMPSDAELVHAARDGDGLALGTLLDRHRAALYSHALQILGRREDAADAVQETFVLAVARLHQLRDANAAKGWLYTILRSVCFMQMRRPHREIATAEIEALAERPDEAVGSTPLQEWVLTALDGLPEPCKRLLHVVTSAGISVVEREFVNPSDDPDHCPPGVTDVPFHDGGDVVRRARAYFEPRADNPT